MRLLVTGGAGFIGSAVVRLAVARGHEVVTLDALTYAACLANLDPVAASPRHRFVQADIRDGAALAGVLSAHRPDAVLHLAAESHVDRSIDGPLAFVSTNVQGTAVLLEAVRAWWEGAGRPAGFRFIHVSTDEVYGSLPPDPALRFTEETPYAPRSPYAASKAASDHLARAWHETFGLPVIVTNCSNNYGPYHFPEKLIPVTILNALAGRALPIYGRGANVRDWLFVEDHAEALLTVAKRGRPGRGYNIGAGAERSNLALVGEICALLDRLRPRPKGAYGDLIAFVPDRPGHDARYAIDPARIAAELGWRARVSLAEGLERTVRWYLENEGWWRALLDRPGVGARLGLGGGTGPQGRGAAPDPGIFGDR